MSKNDITGDRLVSRANTDSYNKNFEKIFKSHKHNPEFCPECGSELVVRLEGTDVTQATFVVQCEACRDRYRRDNCEV